MKRAVVLETDGKYGGFALVSDLDEGGDCAAAVFGRLFACGLGPDGVAGEVFKIDGCYRGASDRANDKKGCENEG